MTLTWTDLTQDWGTAFRRLQGRFPHLDDSAMPFLKLDRDRFEAYLAETHQMTMAEAHAEFEDFLFVEGLNREVDA